MKRWVGEASSVNSCPILTVSVENEGWSEAEWVKASSMQEVHPAIVAAAIMMIANICRRDFM